MYSFLALIKAIFLFQAYFVILSLCTADPYKILGVSKDANVQQIQKIYRRKALKLHPDKNKDKNAAKHMSELNEAYEILSNEEKRKNYDAHGSLDGIQFSRKMNEGDPYGAFFTHFNFDFDWSTGFFRDVTINLGKYEKDIIPASARDPILIVIYAQTCVLCYKFEPIIERLAKDYGEAGIKVYAVNSFKEQTLVKKLNAPAAHEPSSSSFFSFTSDFGTDRRKPSVVGILDGKVTPYQSPTLIPSTTGLTAFLRDKLILPHVTLVSIADDVTRFYASILSSATRLSDNRVRLLIFPATSKISAGTSRSGALSLIKPKLRHLALAYRLRSCAIIGFVPVAPDSGPAFNLTRELRTHLGLSSLPAIDGSDVIAVLWDFEEGEKLGVNRPTLIKVRDPFKTSYVDNVITRLSKLTTSRTSAKLFGPPLLPLLPRISSQPIFDRLCTRAFIDLVPGNAETHSPLLGGWRACSLLLIDDQDFEAALGLRRVVRDGVQDQRPSWSELPLTDNVTTSSPGQFSRPLDSIFALRLFKTCARIDGGGGEAEEELPDNHDMGLGYILVKKQAKFLDSLLITTHDHVGEGHVSKPPLKSSSAFSSSPSFARDVLGPALNLARLTNSGPGEPVLIPILTLIRLPYREIRYRLDVVPYHDRSSASAVRDDGSRSSAESLLYSISFRDSQTFSQVTEIVNRLSKKGHDGRTHPSDDAEWCRNNLGALGAILSRRYFEMKQTPLGAPDVKRNDGQDDRGLFHYDLISSQRSEAGGSNLRMDLGSILPHVSLGYKPLVDEFAAGLLRRTFDRLVTYKTYVNQGLDRDDALTVLSVIFSFLFILGGGYFMAYLVRLEEEKIAQENRDYPTKLPNRIVNQDMIFHELKPGTYNALIRLLKPGCRTILILLNEETKDKLLDKFSRIVHPYRKNVSLMFGFVMIDKHITWYRRLLLQVIGNGRKLIINPKNCVGTVLSINGYRKYYCIYHARHSEPGPGIHDDGTSDPEQDGGGSRPNTPPPPSYSSLLLSAASSSTSNAIGTETSVDRGEADDHDSGIVVVGTEEKITSSFNEDRAENIREPLLGSQDPDVVTIRRKQKCNQPDGDPNVSGRDGTVSGGGPNMIQTQRNTNNPLFVEDLLIAFPDWLERLFEGTVQRYYIDYWPPMKI